MKVYCFLKIFKSEVVTVLKIIMKLLYSTPTDKQKIAHIIIKESLKHLHQLMILNFANKKVKPLASDCRPLRTDVKCCMLVLK